MRTQIRSFLRLGSGHRRCPAALPRKPNRCAIRHFDGDIPLTTGQPDRGAGAYQFTAYTIYDPLVAWEMDVSDRRANWCRASPPNGRSMTRQDQMAIYAAAGVKFHDGSDFTPMR